jgi:hypothetical protein
MCHQVSGYAHANEGIESFLNKDNCFMTSAKKNSSIKANALNKSSSKSNLATSIVVIINALPIGFN